MNPDRAPTPILYSFRRCPYAMRARMALDGAGIELEHREVLLRNKPPSMLAASAKGTVPVLLLQDGTVIDESRDVMQWALGLHDPQNWLGTNNIYLDVANALIDQCDGDFKKALDCYKYADRHPLTAGHYRQQGLLFLEELESRLSDKPFLAASRLSVADIAIMPFIRQFAQVDKAWFGKSGFDELNRWLESMITSDLFIRIMRKRPLWEFEATTDA